ncbi:uncharacterized protein BKA78DRAFT_11669 [Phyllosticta capitalensis]|uniref:uncharacterized protein n=1 Tax=Phyllosticta capitalensis TaxID=121624 RepID=UPI003130EB1E
MCHTGQNRVVVRLLLLERLLDTWIPFHHRDRRRCGESAGLATAEFSLQKHPNSDGGQAPTPFGRFPARGLCHISAWHQTDYQSFQTKQKADSDTQSSPEAGRISGTFYTTVGFQTHVESSFPMSGLKTRDSELRGGPRVSEASMPAKRRIIACRSLSGGPIEALGKLPPVFPRIPSVCPLDTAR